MKKKSNLLSKLDLNSLRLALRTMSAYFGCLSVSVELIMSDANNDNDKDRYKVLKCWRFTAQKLTTNGDKIIETPWSNNFKEHFPNLSSMFQAACIAQLAEQRFRGARRSFLYFYQSF